MSIDNIVSIIISILPYLILILGGQWLLNRYEISQKSKEQEIELVRAVWLKQYEAVEAIYQSFERFMALYRNINDRNTDLMDSDQRNLLLRQAIEYESEIDGLVLRISCEFAYNVGDELGELLGHLRQSVQLWRESISVGEPLPFHSSEQVDYVKFKDAFAGVASYVVQEVYNRLEPPQIDKDEARALLSEIFSNKYESLDYKPTGKKTQNKSY